MPIGIGVVTTPMVIMTTIVAIITIIGKQSSLFAPCPKDGAL
jgi:hypothetical protein